MIGPFRYFLFMSLIINLLRFPYVFNSGGHGAFLYIYFIVSVVLGGCLLMGELILGKTTDKTLGAGIVHLLHDKFMLEKTTNKRAVVDHGRGVQFQYVVLLMNFFVMMYLSVISIWLLHSFVNSLFKIDFNVTTQSALAAIHFLFIYFLYKKQNSLKKVESFLTFFGFLLIVFMFLRALYFFKDNSELVSLFYPDYSKLKWHSLQAALGHCFFSLLLGFGVVCQFGTKLPKNRDVTALATRWVFLSFLSAVAVTVISMNSVYGKSFSYFGYRYFIETLPRIFTDSLPWNFLAQTLLLVLYIVVSTFVLRLMRIFRKESVDTSLKLWPREQTLLYLIYAAGTYLMVFLSSFYKHIRIVYNNGFFDLYDEVVITLVFPIYLFIVILFIYRASHKKNLQREFSAIEIDQEISHFYPIWKSIVLWGLAMTLCLGLCMFLISFVLLA